MPRRSCAALTAQSPSISWIPSMSTTPWRWAGTAKGISASGRQRGPGQASAECPPEPVQTAVAGGPDVLRVADPAANFGVVESQEGGLGGLGIELHGACDGGGPAHPPVGGGGPPVRKRAAA